MGYERGPCDNGFVLGIWEEGEAVIDMATPCKHVDEVVLDEGEGGDVAMCDELGMDLGGLLGVSWSGGGVEESVEMGGREKWGWTWD